MRTNITASPEFKIDAGNITIDKETWVQISPWYREENDGTFTDIPRTFQEVVQTACGFSEKSRQKSVLLVSCNGDEILRVDADGSIYIRGEKAAQVD